MADADIKPGDNILWKGGGPMFAALSFLLSLFDRSWRERRDWRPWHTGLVLKVLPSGEIVTLQAVAKGVQVVTYGSLADMGDCRIYRWLNHCDPARLEDWAECHLRWGYDCFGYVTTAVGAVSMFLFKHPFRVVDQHEMCWEVVSECDRAMGVELQPECEPVLISKIINVLESEQCQTYPI